MGTGEYRLKFGAVKYNSAHNNEYLSMDAIKVLFKFKVSIQY